MKKSNQKNSVERIIKDPTYTIYSKGGVAKNGSKPTQSGDNKPSNVVPFPMPNDACLLYTSPSPRDRTRSRMPSSA